MNEDRQLAIIGAGAFGTALAQSLARAGIEVTLWGRNAALLAKLQRDRQSRALPAVTLDAKIRATAEGAAVQQRLALLAVPLVAAQVASLPVSTARWPPPCRLLQGD